MTNHEHKSHKIIKSHKITLLSHWNVLYDKVVWVLAKEKEQKRDRDCARKGRVYGQLSVRTESNKEMEEWEEGDKGVGLNGGGR